MTLRTAFETDTEFTVQAVRLMIEGVGEQNRERYEETASRRDLAQGARALLLAQYHARYALCQQFLGMIDEMEGKTK